MIKKIIREPGSGKTRDIMKMCAEEGATFVCKNPEAMEVKAHAYGCGDIEIISYQDYILDSKYNKYNCYFDDIDELLEFLGFRVKGFGGNI